jgi:hypothetical protein
MALRSGNGSPFSQCQTAQTAHLVPAAHCARVFANFFHPDEGWAERRQAPGCSGIRWARCVTQDARERAYVTQRAGALARRPCVP